LACAPARALHDMTKHVPERITTMQNLKPAELTTVLGGAKQNDQITQQITALTTSLKDAVAAKDGNGGGNQTFMLLAMVMAMRPQPTVVAAGGPPPGPAIVAAPAPSSVVNISNRIRHF
jgi:hypothetical protein